MTENHQSKRLADFEETFGEKVGEALNKYQRNQEQIPDRSELPDGTILSKNGLIEIQEQPTKIPGGEFDVDMIVDAKFCIYGRLASRVADEALNGWSIAVVNVAEAIITGDPDNTISKFKTRTEIGSDQGPVYPKQPHRLFKRSVRGMLPHKKPRGREALNRIRAYKQNPYSISGLKLDGTKVNTSMKRHISIKELSEKLGTNQEY